MFSGLTDTSPAACSAAGLLERGLAVFALPAGSKRAPAGWEHRVTTDPGDVAAWPPGSNVGIGCRASAIVGLDLDRKSDAGVQVDGVDTLQALCARARRPWPATFTVSTAGGGLHLYFRAPAAIVPSAIARWPGIDVRAPGHRIGGYLVAPGSRVEGRPYVIARDLPIAGLPPWLIAHLTRPLRGRS